MTLDKVSLLALADARHHARASLAALRAMSTDRLTGDNLVALSRVAAQVADVTAELERLEQRARLQP